MAVELHGHTRQVFPAFDEEASYLEAITVTDHDEAVELFRAEGADWGAEPELERIWMRRVEGVEAEAFLEAGTIVYECDEFWWECDEDHADAVPFWKDGP